MNKSNCFIKTKQTDTKSNSIIQKYIEKEEIGKNILKSFIGLYYPGKGFSLDNKDTNVGIISNIMALSTLLEIASLNVDIFAQRKILFSTVDSIFSNVYRKGERAIFDASPYIENNDAEIHIDSYVETISKLLVSMVDFRDFILSKQDYYVAEFHFSILNQKVTSNDQLVECVERLIINCIERLNETCLDNEAPFDYKINNTIIERAQVSSKVQYRGWSFHESQQYGKSAFTTSLYFTYQATNAFLSFYEVFRPYFDSQFENLKIKQEIVKSTSAQQKDNLDKAFFDKNIKLITAFRNRSISSGRYIETKLNENQVDLAFDFITKDFNSVSYSSIQNLQKSNDVINTLLVLNIFLNCGIDDDYSVINQLEYFNDMQQFGLLNVKKVYTIMRKNSNEDIINSYRVLFNDGCPKELETTVKIYRKKCESIAVYDLPPLLCNTYANISKYLIQYPQKEMLENLDIISENRMENTWLWEIENYNVNNNLYYIFAIENFYDYYYTYELPLSKYGEKYNDEAEKAHQELLKDKSAEFSGKKYILVPNAVPDSTGTNFQLDKIMDGIVTRASECVGTNNNLCINMIKDGQFGVNEVKLFKFEERSLKKEAETRELTSDETLALEKYKKLAKEICNE